MTTVVTSNAAERLFVIPAGDGYTCLGFYVCEDMSKRIADWIISNGGKYIPPEQPAGTLEAYERYQALCGIANELCRDLHIRCDIALTPQLIGLEGRRVEVTDNYDQTRRFIVGKSAGWMPCHLELKTSRSTGGGAVTGAPFQNVRVIR